MLVVSRDEVIPVLNNVVVAPVTSTIREIPTCVPVGPEEGIDHDTVANFDNLAAVPESVLTTRLGTLGVDGRRRICASPRRSCQLLDLGRHPAGGRRRSARSAMLDDPGRDLGV